MLESIVLGIVQGVTEWLPVSSQSMLVMAKTKLFHANDLSGIIQQALPLRWGTFLAVLFYFRRDVWALFTAAGSLRKAGEETKKTLFFIIFTAIMTGLLGATLLATLMPLTYYFQTSGKLIALFFTILLFVSAILQKDLKNRPEKTTQGLALSDALVLGIAQGLAILPGLSRSGSTIACLLLRHFDKTTTLRLSFLMGLPVMLAGNTALGFTQSMVFSAEALAGLLSSLIFGLLTIQGLLKVAEKIDTTRFTFLLAFLFLLAASL
jgi:undecaprenyl-diphosphatase